MRKTSNYIVLFLVIVLVIYIALLDTLAKPLFESQATEMYGAQVSISALQISPFVGKVTLHDLQVADRRNALRNLAQADRAYVDISILQLARDIVDVQDMQLDGLIVLTPRTSPAEILRPLLDDDDPIAQAGLPNFRMPDVDALIAGQREKVQADISAIKRVFNDKEDKWRDRMAQMPDKRDLDGYGARIETLSQAGDPAARLAAAQELRQLYSEMNRDIEKLQSMQSEFRGDIQLMREEVEMAATLPQRHTDELIASLGLNSEQTAQLGSRLLRGDFDGLLQQVLAPLAFNESGTASSDDSMPIYIRRATANGQLLHSATGLSTRGELSSFAWPLELAAEPTLFKLTGNSMGGGDILIDAALDHRQEVTDVVSVAIDRLPLWQMELAGNRELAIIMEQALATINGELKLQGDQLSGAFTQQLSEAVFSTQLTGDAGESSRLISSLLKETRNFMLQIALGGTVFEPELTFSSDLDQLFADTLRGALTDIISNLTGDLQNRISSEIGPEVASARQQFESLESLQGELQQTLNELSGMSSQD